MHLSYIVVHYRTLDLTLRSLEHIFAAQDPALDSEVIVVDNASKDGSAEAIQARFPAIRLISSPVNAGFGAGNNRGMEAARGDVFALINSDAFIAPGFGRAMLDRLSPRTGVLGPRLRYEDGRLQISCFRFPTPLYAWLENLGIAALLPPGSRWGNYQRWAHDHARSVDFISGACMVVRSEVFRQTRGFDETFFMYAEEADWQRRIRRLGWDVAFVPDVEVVHVAGGSHAAPSHTINPHFFKSLDYYQQKNHGLGGWLLFKLACMTGVLLRLPLWLLKPDRGVRVRFGLAVLWHHLSTWAMVRS